MDAGIIGNAGDQRITHTQRPAFQRRRRRRYSGKLRNYVNPPGYVVG